MSDRARGLQAEPEANARERRRLGRERRTSPSSTHGTNGSQMRSTSAFDMPLRSASAIAAERAADEQPDPPIAQARDRDGGRGTDGERERREVGEQEVPVRAVAARRRAKYCVRVAARPANHEKPAAPNATNTGTTPTRGEHQRAQSPPRRPRPRSE